MGRYVAFRKSVSQIQKLKLPMAQGFVGLQVAKEPPHAVVAVQDLIDQHGVLQVLRCAKAMNCSPSPGHGDTASAYCAFVVRG